MNIWKFLSEVENLAKNLGKTTSEGALIGRPRFFDAFAGFSFPEVNIADDKEQFIVEVVVPGVEPSSLNLSMTGSVLTISGEKPEIKEGNEDAIHRQERTAGKFVRTIDLPTEVDSSKVNAEYRHGVLRVTIAKTPETQPKKIEITVK